MRLRKFLRNKNGSSMISVLVAFIILLLGIAGFGHAVKTANDMVRRSEMLNAATGEMLKKFYTGYVNQTTDSYVTSVREVEVDSDGSETIKTEAAFTLHGRLRTREYNVTITPEDTGEAETEKIKYDMYFYK